MEVLAVLVVLTVRAVVQAVQVVPTVKVQAAGVLAPVQDLAISATTVPEMVNTTPSEDSVMADPVLTLASKESSYGHHNRALIGCLSAVLTDSTWKT